MKNSILLRRNLSLYIPEGNDVLPEKYLGAALKNIEHLGFTFSKELMDILLTLSVDDFIGFYQSLVVDLREMVGDHVHYQPFYPNFPKQVEEMDEFALYINAMIHYVTLKKPSYRTKERFPLLDRVDLKIIQLADEKQYEQTMTALFSAKTSLSASDKLSIACAVIGDKEVLSYLPSEFVHKENMAFILSALLHENCVSLSDVSQHIRTATDVLRLAATLSDGDASLANPTRFGRFSRKERRFLLSLLENIAKPVEDMLRYRNEWVRLGERLHPSEYASRYPKANEAFHVLRNNISVETFRSKVEKALQSENVEEAVSLLVTRPGEFARRLDQLIRLSKSNEHRLDLIADSFKELSMELSTPLLLQLMAHFKGRSSEQPIRAFFPKGNVAKVYGLEQSLPALPGDVTGPMVEICEESLRKRFSVLPSLGNVYIEKKLDSFIVPFSQRSASKSLHTLVRGSRLDIPEGDTLRFFLWWKEGLVNGVHTGRVDIDLSAVFFDEDWSFLETVSFYNLREETFGAVHSGDITAAPNGSSEFIDVDIPTALESKCRYIVMSLNSYSEQPYKDLPECFAGWMIRQEANSGEIYEPSTVQNKLDVSADSTIAMPLIIDLVERKVIWCDLSLTQNLVYSNFVDANKQTMAIVGKALTSLQKPNLYDLFRLHGEARGTIVDSAEKADILFSEDGDVTPYHMETIMSEYLA